jgi:hypothetical protein
MFEKTGVLLGGFLTNRSGHAPLWAHMSRDIVCSGFLDALIIGEPTTGRVLVTLIGGLAFVTPFYR